MGGDFLEDGLSLHEMKVMERKLDKYLIQLFMYGAVDQVAMVTSLHWYGCGWRKVLDFYVEAQRNKEMLERMWKYRVNGVMYDGCIEKIGHFFWIVEY